MKKAILLTALVLTLSTITLAGDINGTIVDPPPPPPASAPQSPVDELVQFILGLLF